MLPCVTQKKKKGIKIWTKGKQVRGSKVKVIEKKRKDSSY